MVKSPYLPTLKIFVVKEILVPRIDVLKVSTGISPYMHVLIFSVHSFVFHVDRI